MVGTSLIRRGVTLVELLVVVAVIATLIVMILPAVQVNVRGGHLPPPEDNGVRYLKIPLNAL